MQYDGLAWAAALVALGVLVAAARILLRSGWLLGWLRGMCGLGFLGLALLLALIAYDLRAYSVLPPSGRPMVTVAFAEEGAQRYRVTLREAGSERNLIVVGDLWQMDARIFAWKGLAALIGLQSGYRLELLSTRYLSEEQQHTAESSRAALAASPYGIDFWRWLREGRHDLFLIDALGTRVSFLPMADGAVYQVSLGSDGVLVEPQSEVARAAVQDRRI